MPQPPSNMDKCWPFDFKGELLAQPIFDAISQVIVMAMGKHTYNHKKKIQLYLWNLCSSFISIFFLFLIYQIFISTYKCGTYSRGEESQKSKENKEKTIFLHHLHKSVLPPTFHGTWISKLEIFLSFFWERWKIYLMKNYWRRRKSKPFTF